MNFTFDTFAAMSGIIAAAGAFAVCAWRISDLSRRVDRLEAAERTHSDHVLVMEGKLNSAITLLERIAEKLNVD